MEENREKIWKIRKKIVKRYGKYVSLFDLPFCHIFYIISQFSYVFSVSFHYFLPYFPFYFTKIVKRYGKYRRKLWNDMENMAERQVEKWKNLEDMEENREKLWKIRKKIVKRYGKYISFHNFLLYFPYLFTIFLPYFPFHFTI
jgi:hypothetical protein